MRYMAKNLRIVPLPVLPAGMLLAHFFFIWILLIQIMAWTALAPNVAHASQAAGTGTGHVTIRYAKRFTVEYRHSSTIIRVNRPWADTDTGFCYQLVHRGTTLAASEREPACQMVETPVRTVVSLSTTHLTFLQSLGLIDRLVGFSTPERVYSEAVTRAWKQGRIKRTGFGSNLQIETVLDLSPDLVLAYGTGTFRDAYPKLMEAGLKVAIDAEYMETHPLGRTEWLKFVALFFEKGREAQRLFSDIEKRYLELSKIASSARNRPTVLVNTPFSGRWYMPRGNSFPARFIHDAGADYIFKDIKGTGSIPLDVEMVYEQGCNAQFWINTGIWTSISQAVESAPRMARFLAIQKHRLYNRTRRTRPNGANDYWESGMMKPDVILSDLIRIFHPDLLPEHRLFYYERLK